ncbi:MAG: hypothetical protein PHF31_13560 [Methylobacter sp.]|nr:hypothetical protein [Methylobacter sp.]
MDMRHYLRHIFIRKFVIPAWIADPLENEANSRYQEVFELAIHDTGYKEVFKLATLALDTCFLGGFDGFVYNNMNLKLNQ